LVRGKRSSSRPAGRPQNNILRENEKAYSFEKRIQINRKNIEKESNERTLYKCLIFILIS
jgi:hypothetical protein